MESSISLRQAIPDQEHDHEEALAGHGAMTSSAESKSTRKKERRSNDLLEGCLDISCPQHHISQTGTTMRANTNTPLGRQARRGLSIGMLGYLLILIASLWIMPASAVFIDFENCLSDGTKENVPLQLQFVPKFVDAVFNTTDPNHNLKVTVWGNVTGSTVGKDRIVLPPANDSYWNSTDTEYGGKILATPFPNDADPKNTTLSNKVTVLTYEPWSEFVNFCGEVVNGTCPLGPVFNVNQSNPLVYPSFGFENNFFSTYAFTSFQATLVIIDGDQAKTSIGCISASITPDLGSHLSNVVTWVPAVILISVGIATAFAAIYSPWGSSDTFRWTTNYGRDADLLRLVTPGFGDCLHYIQFVVLTGSLSLNYPGFYQPVISKVSWSTLMFNESFVSGGNGTQSMIDGIYATHGDYGMDVLRQLVGMSDVDDVWAGMAVWLLSILAVLVVLIQIGFFVRWVYRHLSSTHEEDLRAKNLPFTLGNVIRIVFNYFLLPIVALSMFQLVVAPKSPAVTVGLAVVMLLLIFGFAGWLLYVIASTRPKSYLFDDLPTVLLYGSFYNTYSDHAAPFALVPILLNIIRGIAIGAVQPSGIAQIILLAICEVVTVMTLHAFRPFHSPTSMNAYHTFFSTVRFTTILLMVAFAPSLGVTEGPKGWIGYAILLMHAIVLILGFFLNAIQTIVEVAARMAGAGGDESGAARGGLVKVFGMRQLSKRLPRHHAHSRQSHMSNSSVLEADHDRKSYIMDGGRVRSQSAGSTGVLLNRQSTAMDNNSVDPYGAIPSHVVRSGDSSYTPTTPGEASTFSFLPSAAAPSGLGRNRGPILALDTGEASDPYYRPPRLRRPTIETFSPGSKSRGSWASGDFSGRRWSRPETAAATDAPEDIPTTSGGQTPTQALESNLNDPRRSKADYTTRESDFYYGVRGPALNANIPSRRIKTGPADPTGIPASAAGWFKGLFGGKTKEKGKGFEVVRSSRMPPNMRARNAPGQETPPEGIPVATGGVRNGPIDSDDESNSAGPSNQHLAPSAPTTNENAELVTPLGSESSDSEGDEDEYDITRISDVPPTLSGLEIPGGGIELPSRFPSKATSRASSRRLKPGDVPVVPGIPSRVPSRKPTVPRKSSKRHSQNVSVDLSLPEAQFMRHNRTDGSMDSTRLPFERSNSTKRHSDISTRSGITDPSALGHSRTPSAGFAGKFHEDMRDDRPTSVGYVNQHSIQTINPSENPNFLGASAEVFEAGRRSGASSMENSRS